MFARLALTTIWGLMNCTPLAFSSPTTHKNDQRNLIQLIARHKTAVKNNSNLIAKQDITVEFSNSQVDISTESRVIYINGSVVNTRQVLKKGAAPIQIVSLPKIFEHPLYRLPVPVNQEEESIQEGSEEHPEKVTCRLLKPETYQHKTYDVLEVTQDSDSDENENQNAGVYQATRVVCKYYLDKQGLVQRKTGTLFYRIPTTEPNQASKPITHSAKFYTTSIVYQKPQQEAPTTPTVHP